MAVSAVRFMWLVWLCFVLRGLFFVVTLPLWEGFDEPSHFGVIDFVARYHAWPKAQDRLPVDVKDSLDSLPLPRALAETGQFTHDRYWQLPEFERELLQQRFARLGGGPGAVRPRSGNDMYEAQQAPIYYLAMAAPYHLMFDWGLADRVLALRMITLSMSSLVVPAAFWVGRSLGGAGLGLAACGLLVAMPQFVMTSARIANDALAALVVAIVAVLVVCYPRLLEKSWTAAAVGLVAGLAMLTKGYLILLLPALALGGRITLVCAGLSGGWWYARNLWLTGSLSGEQLEVMSGTQWGRDLAVDWLAVGDFIAKSHLWLGNWSFLGVRSWMYHLVECWLAIAGVFGLAWSWKFCRRMAFLVCVQTGMILAVFYHALVTYWAQGKAGSLGHYLDGAIVAEVVIVAAGCGRWWPGLLAALLALDLFGTHIYLLPYYAGLIAHNASGGLAGFPILQSDWAGMAARLAVHKGSVGSPVWIEAAWVGYLVANAGLVAIAIQAWRARLVCRWIAPVRDGAQPDPQVGYDRRAGA